MTNISLIIIISIYKMHGTQTMATASEPNKKVIPSLETHTFTFGLVRLAYYTHSGGMLIKHYLNDINDEQY